jgi:hypothetical protein
MLHRFENGWIETKDFINVRSYKFYRERRVVQALRFLILSWSAEAKINEATIGMLKNSVVETIFNRLLDQISWFMLLEDDKVLRIIKAVLKGQRVREEIAEKIVNNYFDITFACFDHRGNIINLPYSGGYYEQPADVAKFMNLYKIAFLEVQEHQKR